jgi:hypothetical protein
MIINNEQTSVSKVAVMVCLTHKIRQAECKASFIAHPCDLIKSNGTQNDSGIHLKGLKKTMYSLSHNKPGSDANLMNPRLKQCDCTSLASYSSYRSDN